MAVAIFDPQGIAACEAEPADLSADAAGIEAVWDRNYSGPQTERVPQYRQHPEGPGHVFVLRTEGRIVGAAGLFLRKLSHAGGEATIGCVGNVAVDEAHRMAASIVKLLRALCSSDAARQCEFVLGVTHRIVPFLTRVGFRPVGLMERWTKPLRCGAFLERRLGSSRLAALLAPAGDALLRLRDLSFRHTTGSGPIPQFPEAVDALWHSRRRALGLSFGRTARLLNWEFAGRHQIFTLPGSDGSLRGYLVFEEGPSGVQVVDFLAETALDLRSLFREFTRHVRRTLPAAVAIHVSQFGGSGQIQPLKSLGFSARPHGGQVLVRPNPARESELARRAVEPGHWFLTESDGGV